MKFQLPEYIEIVDTRDKKNNLKTIKYKDKFLHSPYNPLKEAEEELKKYPDCNKYESIIIFGLGMGYILDALENKLHNKNIKIIGIEYEKNFQYFIKGKQYNNPVTFIFHEDRDRVCSFLFEHFNKIPLKKILFIELKPLIEINIDYYQYIKEKIKTWLQQKVADLTTTVYFNEQWLFNSFINLYNLKNFILINELKNRFIHKTALLVSSGPTAEEDINFIKNFKGYIFCLPPSVNYLLKNNVSPDFIILGDSNFNNIYHLKKAFKLNLLLMTDLSVHYSLLSKWNGSLILFNYNIPGFEYIYNRLKIDYIPQGGTIASSAITIMKYMGFNKILLCGQDFAYKDYKLHIKGSGYELYHLYRNTKFKNKNNLNFELIKDNQCEYQDGKIIDHKLKLYREWFYKLIESLNISIENKDHYINYKKEKLRLNLREKFTLKKELTDLLKKLKSLQVMDVTDKAAVEKFMRDLETDKELYELIKGFNFQLFLKINRGLKVDREEFFNNIILSLDKIKWLVNYNLQG